MINYVVNYELCFKIKIILINMSVESFFHFTFTFVITD